MEKLNVVFTCKTVTTELELNSFAVLSDIIQYCIIKISGIINAYFIRHSLPMREKQ